MLAMSNARARTPGRGTWTSDIDTSRTSRLAADAVKVSDRICISVRIVIEVTSVNPQRAAGDPGDGRSPFAKIGHGLEHELQGEARRSDQEPTQRDGVVWAATIMRSRDEPMGGR